MYYTSILLDLPAFAVIFYIFVTFTIVYHTGPEEVIYEEI